MLNDSGQLPYRGRTQEGLCTVGTTYLKEVQKAADDADLKFSGAIVFADATAQEIVKAAKENGYDAPFEFPLIP